jgi:hypothetical protein
MLKTKNVPNRPTRIRRLAIFYSLGVAFRFRISRFEFRICPEGLFRI